MFELQFSNLLHFSIDHSVVDVQPGRQGALVEDQSAKGQGTEKCSHLHEPAYDVGLRQSRLYGRHTRPNVRVSSTDL